MKKISRIIFMISVVLLVFDLIYVVFSSSDMTILHFLGFLVLVPCILLASIISCLIAEMPFHETGKQGIATGIVVALLSAAAYVLANRNYQHIQRIIENTKNMTASMNLSISDISISSGFSSYVFIFVFVFVMTMGFNLIFNGLRLKEEKNVSK